MSHAVAEAQPLIDRLEDAVARIEPRAICEGVKAALRTTPLALPEHFLRATPDRYARRLLYRCPNGTYSVMVMVWAPGQGTPVHDHAGKWCVESLYRGRMRVTLYEPASEVSADVVRFRPAGTRDAKPGDVGTFVPPNEYHAMHNPGGDTAVTIHVYEGEMLWCHAFHHLDGDRYRKEKLDLRYTRDPAP